ncbi:MAG: hypothetical protein QM765_39305 [Myxococcales bacterium]
MPTAITAAALCGELERNARTVSDQMARIQKERAGLTRERAELEKLARQVEEEREKLREEIDRLASFVELGAEDKKGGGGAHDAAGKLARWAAGAPGRTPLDGMAKTIKAMKPAAAADLVARLDRDVGAAVLARLKPKDASAVMDKLKPDVAADLLSRMAERAGPGSPEAKR